MPDSDAQVEVEHLDPIEFRQVLYRQYKEVEDLEKIVTHVNVNQRQQRHISLITSLENDIVDMIDKPRMQLDLDTAITQGPRVGGHLYSRQSPSLRVFRKAHQPLHERFQKRGDFSDLAKLVALC